MNDRRVSLPHGGPCRLRVEDQLGYKMCKFLHSIELVESYAHVGQGQGGHREDNRYYGFAASI